MILGATAGAALFAAGMLLRKVAAVKLLPGAFLVGTLGAVISSLTIVVTDEEIRASFGPGLTINRVRLAEVDSVRTVRNPWYYGFGIRITPRGLLYNVTGLDAVEGRMRSGSTFQLGTDQPDRLRRALEEAITAASLSFCGWVRSCSTARAAWRLPLNTVEECTWIVGPGFG